VTLLAWIALGGAIGALARYGMTGIFQGPAGAVFPWGTFAVNASGSFLIGFTLRWVEATTASPNVRAFLSVGLLGAFTTFSTFSWEAVKLIQDGAWLRATGYVAGSVATGLVAVVAGIALAAAIRHGAEP
jgi:fluoride exporter